MGVSTEVYGSLRSKCWIDYGYGYQTIATIANVALELQSHDEISKDTVRIGGLQCLN